MANKVIIIGIIASMIIGITAGISYFASEQINVDDELESQNYEDICGYPVTDQMRLDTISKMSFRFNDPPYLELHPGKFTHVERSQYLTDIPILQYWFDLDNGKQIYFEIEACDLDGSSMTLTEIGPNYGKEPQVTDFDATKYRVLAAPGSPLIYKDTLLPVLDVDNCERVADNYSKEERPQLYTRETTTFDPPWENQVFPLMDYCTSIGNYELKTLDGNINWSFTLFE